MYITFHKDRILVVFFLGIIVFGLWQAAAVESVPAMSMPVSQRVVLIDAGHGAFDPGKVAGRIEEKDINLAISLRLQEFLETGGATVIMTRIDDTALAEGKRGDMYRRQQIANASHADIFVSIHQNAFSSPNVRGAQVFYFDTSDNSRKLAEHIQAQLRAFADPSNRLQSKANTNYYVLRQTRMPAVIVECGFLTNPTDRARLTREEYQDKVAWAIYMGIASYFEEL